MRNRYPFEFWIMAAAILIIATLLSMLAWQDKVQCFAP